MLFDAFVQQWRDSMDWEIKFDSYWSHHEKKMMDACVEKGYDYDELIDLIKDGWKGGIEMEISITQHDPTP